MGGHFRALKLLLTMLVLLAIGVAGRNQGSGAPPETRPSDDRKEVAAVVTAMYRGMSARSAADSKPVELAALCTKHARINAVDYHSAPPGSEGILSISPEQWAAVLDRAGSDRGLIRELASHIDLFGETANVFSTWEKRTAETDRFPLARGIAGIQLVKGSSGWRIASIAFSEELADRPIPEELLPKDRKR